MYWRDGDNGRGKGSDIIILGGVDGNVGMFEWW